MLAYERIFHKIEYVRYVSSSLEHTYVRQVRSVVRQHDCTITTVTVNSRHVATDNVAYIYSLLQYEGWTVVKKLGLGNGIKKPRFLRVTSY